MDKESTQNSIIIQAYNKGYRVTIYGEVFGLKGNKLSLSCNTAGYCSFNLRFKKNPTRVFVHKLQAYQKFGDRLFEKGILVRHLDGNSKNNSFENIEIGTSSDNMLDKSTLDKKLGRSGSSVKHNHEEIMKDKGAGMTYSELMKKYNISSKGTIAYIMNSSLKKQSKVEQLVSSSAS